jgi:hypothetical protein
MRSVRFLAVAVLAVVLAASMFSFASAQPEPINVRKVTTNGDATTLFHFTLSTALGGFEVDLAGGSSHGFDVQAGTYVLHEDVPSGWVLKDISCGFLDDVVVGGRFFAFGSLGVSSYGPADQASTFAVNLADHSVTIVLVEGDYVFCTFTDSPAATGPVGGFVEPINKVAVFAPYLALLGVIAVMVVAVAPWKKREN